jgi:hypothetical protein
MQDGGDGLERPKQRTASIGHYFPAFAILGAITKWAAHEADPQKSISIVICNTMLSLPPSMTIAN